MSESFLSDIYSVSAMEAAEVIMPDCQKDTPQACASEQVFANSYVDLGRVDTVGFDYDYTLVIEGASHVAYCEQIFDLGYTVEEEQCLYDICVIDSTYAMDILYSLEDIYVDWSSIVVTEDMCPHCESQ